jgi:hypothetical protein
VASLNYFDSKRSAVEALRSLAGHSGVPLSRIAALASEGRLNDLFDVETRALKYRDGKRIATAELRSFARAMSGHDAVARMICDPRKALADLHAKRRRW